MSAYYNEIDRFNCDWLSNLMDANLITPGKIDDRSIVDVRFDEVAGFERAHFFAGIGGWELALNLAGWTGPVWTGSCPCQPFSRAGKRLGAADERHLWPDWFGLISQSRPPVVFGEQVARAIGFSWLDAVAHDLEGEGYAVGAAVLPACSVGAPHQRDRLWFVADAGSAKLRHEPGRSGWQGWKDPAIAGAHGAPRPLADADHGEQSSSWPPGRMGRVGSAGEDEDNGELGGIAWPAEPDLPRVAHGIPNRMGLLRGFGNAIVPQVAATFIRAAM